MSCSQDDLEAVAREELPWAETQRVLGHVSGCAACARELAWLHTESTLARRPDEPAAELWPAVAVRVRPSRRGVVAGAAAAVALAAAVVLALLPRSRPVEVAAPMAAPPPAPVVVAPAPAPPAPEPPPVEEPPRPARPGHLLPLLPGEREGSLRVRGPVTIEIVADGAALTVDRCAGRFVNLRTQDDAHRTVTLVARGGRVRAELDGDPALRGRARLLAPRGSRVVVRGTASVTDVSNGAVRVERR